MSELPHPRSSSGVLLLAAGLAALATARSAAAADPAPAGAREILSEKFALQAAPAPGLQRLAVRELLPGEIKGVSTPLLSITGPWTYLEPSTPDQDKIYLFLRGKGTLRAHDQSFPIEDETIARLPVGWPAELEAPAGAALHVLVVRRQLEDRDLAELKKYPDNNAAAYVKKFRDCTPYGEAIKSAKTVSRTLLPENVVPRTAMGTVETAGPDKVGAHAHPMLDQLFLGLKDHDVTVHADEASKAMTENTLLHIPLGSSHWVEVGDGRKLYYVWMDFFESVEGQQWLKMHKPVQQNKP